MATSRFIFGSLIFACALPSFAETLPQISYPPAPRSAVEDPYFGSSVSDPYRWLENVDAPETRAWVQAQQALTGPILAALPERQRFAERLKVLWNYERRSAPVAVDGTLYFLRNDGLQNQPVLWQQRSGAAARVMLDPNSLSADGTTAVTQWKVSPHNKNLAYALSVAGSDWETVHFLPLSSATPIPDVLSRVKFSNLTWAADGQSLAYSRYPSPDAAKAPAADAQTFESLSNHTLYWHNLGQPQTQDVIVHKPEDPSWTVVGEISNDGRYLYASVAKGASDDNRLYVYPVQANASAPVGPVLTQLGGDFSASYVVLGNKGSTLYVLTTDKAPNKRIVAIDLQRPQAQHWITVVPESQQPIDTALYAGGQIVVKTLRDARAEVRHYQLDGRLLGNIKLPGLGDVIDLTGNPESSTLYLQYASFIQPPSIYSVALARGKTQAWFTPKLPFVPAQYKTEQVFYQSKDGTKVPMFISYKKGLKKTGSNPTLLYGYGGFNISLLPAYSPQNLAWMEQGGIYAQPNLRGGGEYGEAWHQAGTKAQKQNVFDDFAAAAEYLIAKGYTSAKHLGIYGRSNGGLLVGASVNQRPELFAAAVPGVGVMDMLRFHQFTIGGAWRDDYGSSETAEGFAYLRAYSPVHNITPGRPYPPTLTITADHDDRVVPGHSFKYAATMQFANAGNPNPQLIRIEENGGHGAGKPIGKKIDEVADVLGFLRHYTQ